MKPATAGPEGVSIEEAYARCERLTRTHYENFTVVSWFLPRPLRRHFHAVYAFAATSTTLATRPPETGWTCWTNGKPTCGVATRERQRIPT